MSFPLHTLLVGALLLGAALGCGRVTNLAGEKRNSDEQSELDESATTGQYYSDAQLRQIAISAGFKGWEADTMVTIAKCESSGQAGSWNSNSSKGQHTGLWQVGDYHAKPCGYSTTAQFRKAMQSAYANARCAYIVYTGSYGQGMKGFGNWDCYTGRR